MLFPAAKLMDPVIGIDLHTVIIPPAPAPIPMIPHPYMGALMLWNTPQFPVFSSGIVLINGLPACTVGAMGLTFHIPQGLPAPPPFTNLLTYWRHHLTNIPKLLGFMMKMIFVNLAVSGLAGALAAVSKKDGNEGAASGAAKATGAAGAAFLYDVAGIDQKSRTSAWEVIKGNLSAFTQWQTYVQLLIPPVPYPGGQGSTAIGSPNVFVNGGHLAFAAPMVTHSCSDIPLVPNGGIPGVSNVMVGVSMADLIRSILVQTAKGGLAYGVTQASAGETPCSK